MSDAQTNRLQHPCTDVFFAVPVHGETLSKGFSLAPHESGQAFWNALTEFIAVEIQWWCEDRKLEPDFKCFEQPYFYRIDRTTGVLEDIKTADRLNEVARSSSARRDSFAFFANSPGPHELACVMAAYVNRFPSPAFETLKLASSKP